MTELTRRQLLAGALGAANGVIESSIKNGELAITALVDGELTAGCAPVIAWTSADHPRKSDCTAELDVFPFAVPSFKIAVPITNAKYDPATQELSGLVDEALLISQLDPSVRSVADGWISLDVDTDGDNKADRASTFLKLVLAP